MANSTRNAMGGGQQRAERDAEARSQERERMTELGKPEAKLIDEALKKACVEIAERFGLTVQVGGGTIYPSEGTFKPRVEFALADSARLSFEANAALVGLEPSDFGATFSEQGRSFTITSINLRARKRPVIVTETATGRQFSFTEAAVKRLLGLARAS